MDLSHSYSIDGNSANHIATYDVTVQDKAGSISSPYFKATLIVGSDGSVLVSITFLHMYLIILLQLCFATHQKTLHQTEF